MDANQLFDAIWEAIKNTDIDFAQEYVGDEESGEIYFKFKNVRENDNGC